MTEEELTRLNRPIERMKSGYMNISVKAFFEKYFSLEEYEVFISTTQKAIHNAKEIISLKAVPQLLPGNMLLFKKRVLGEFTEDKLSKLFYEFKEGKNACNLSEEDLYIIKKSFLEEYRDAIVGKADFAKCFITSEYLFATVGEGLSIDYTAVVVGYLKSVEQLLYLLYLSAFQGKNELCYWDKCSDEEYFDIKEKDRYRINPYTSKYPKKQKKYQHNKKTGKNAPAIGELIWFLRYFEKMWRISESGKEYVYKCLNDFRDSCRNSLLHKDNLNASDYSTVERIRNNAHVCLYYLLGGFYFLDNSPNGIEQRGIIDYRFEDLYQSIRQKPITTFDATFHDGSQCVICYLNHDEGVEYEETGELKNARLLFLKTGIKKEDAYFEDVSTLLNDEDFISKHSMYISPHDMPLDIQPIYLKKEREIRDR